MPLAMRSHSLPPKTGLPRPRALLLLLTALAALVAGLVLAPAPAAEAVPPTVQTVEAAPAKIAAAAGQSTITVTVAPGDEVAAARVTLTTTLGAFGSAAGPSRVTVALSGRADGTAVATATLVGDGRLGAAAVTARVGTSTRSTTITFVGAPATVVFETPSAEAVLSAATPPRLIVQVRDSAGVSLSGASLTFTADAGRMLPSSDPTAAAAAGAYITATDATGRASAFLHADPGAVRVRAAAGAATATLPLTLHGPPAQLELTALARRVNLGDTPFAAPAGTLVAVLFDEGGRPVPRVAVRFSADVAGVTVVQSGEGESGVTGASGRAAAHLSAADAAETGPVTIMAQAGSLSASTTVQIVGPAARLQLVLRPHSEAGAYDVAALVSDAAGAAVPSGYTVRFSAVGALPSAQAGFEPVAAETMDGLARTRFTLTGATEGVQVRAYVADIDVDVRASAPLPEARQAVSLSLAAGLNLVTWPGSAMTASEALAPIVESVSVLWRYDESDGWQRYLPAAGQSVDFEIANGDLLAVATSEAVVWTVPAAPEDEEDGDGAGDGS